MNAIHPNANLAGVAATISNTAEVLPTANTTPTVTLTERHAKGLPMKNVKLSADKLLRSGNVRFN